MTLKEAITLESLCEAYVYRECAKNVGVSMALTGALKFTENSTGNYITFKLIPDDDPSVYVDYVNYHGYYTDLFDTISLYENSILEHFDDFKLLLWSYEHRRELVTE